jgi:hypothetical protein
MTKNRFADPSEFCALDFEGEFRRLEMCSVSVVVGTDRSIFGAFARMIVSL